MKSSKRGHSLQETLFTKFRLTLRSGIQAGVEGLLWIMKILVPISFVTALLEFSGWTYILVGWLKPAMGWLSLPPEAALPIITGLLIGIYGGIGVMATLPLTADQMTLIAIFLLIAHNLIQEGIIQGNSGIHIIKITVARLLVAVAAVVVVAQFLASDTTTQPFSRNIRACHIWIGPDAEELVCGYSEPLLEDAGHHHDCHGGDGRNKSVSADRSSFGRAWTLC
jgi:hypothetical protein